jgi:hypothetical protein
MVIFSDLNFYTAHPHIIPRDYITLHWKYYDEHTLRSLSTSQVCLSWSFWCSQSDPRGASFLGHFGGLFEGSKKGWKMTKNRHLDEKITSPHTLKNFSTYKIRYSITLNSTKIIKISKEPKNTKKWRFLTPFRRPSKTAIFSPFLRVPKNDDFFVINGVNNKNFSSKSLSRKKSGTSILGRGRGGSPLIFRWKSSRWYL